MFCPSCGKENPDTNQFCGVCGERISINYKRDLTGKYAPEICAICKGSGKYIGTFLITKCPGCGGSGSVLVIQPAHKCGICNGTGQVKGTLFGTYVCDVCDGSGWAHAKRSEKSGFFDSIDVKFQQPSHPSGYSREDEDYEPDDDEDDDDEDDDDDSTGRGYCIRCGVGIRENPNKPLCSKCYSIWEEYSNRHYPENFCHICGKGSNQSYSKPICYKCYKKYFK
jgi:hypothetical protein